MTQWSDPQLSSPSSVWPPDDDQGVRTLVFDTLDAQGHTRVWTLNVVPAA